MGSFGGGSKSKSSKSKSKTQTVQMGNYYSPLGNVTSDKKGNVSFSPDGQLMGLFRQSGDRIGSTMNQLPTSFSVGDMYNNPFYNNTASLMQMPIDRQYRQQKTDLTNSLNARNQIGSSYDALANNLLNQNYDYNSNQAQLQARQASADAYNQNLNNLLNTLSGLNSTQSNQASIMYQPIGAAQGFQNNLQNALQNSSLDTYRQQSMQNSLLSSILGAAAGFGRTAATIA